EVTFHTTSLEGLVANPDAMTAIVNTNQSATSQITITNYSSQPRDFTATLENNVVAELAFIDSDQPGGPEFVWNDISMTGTHLDQISDAEDDFEPIGISFDFPYFGQTYRTVYVCSNGFASVGAGASNYKHEQLPSPDAPGNQIAAFHNDLNLGDSGDVYYQDFGDRVIIQFSNAARYAGDGTSTFQMVLNHDGTIFFYYKEMNGTVDDATVGIQNSTGDQGLSVAYNQQYLKNNLAVKISSAATWLQVDPPAGSLAAGGSANLQLRFAASGGLFGSYTAMMHVTAAVPSASSVTVPV